MNKSQSLRDPIYQGKAISQFVANIPKEIASLEDSFAMTAFSDNNIL